MRNCIIARLSFFSLLLLPFYFKRSNTKFYFDPGSYNKNFFTLIIAKLTSHDFLSKLIIIYGNLLGLKLIPVPIRDNVEIYPEIFLRANQKLIEIIDSVISDKFKTYQSHCLTSSLKEAYSRLSINQKRSSWILWSILENIELLNSTGNKVSFIYSFPRSVDSRFIFSFSKKYQIQKIILNLKSVSIVNSLLVIYNMIVNFFNYLILKVFKIEKNYSFENKHIITEFFDLNNFNEEPGDVNFLESNNELKEKITYFVASEQEKLHKNLNSEKLFKRGIIRLKFYVLSTQNLREFFHLYKTIFIAAFFGKIEAENLMFQINDIEKYLALQNLFGKSNYRFHLYTIFPSGSSGLRENSGYITELCHRFKISNCGIQSRVHYSHSYPYYFNYEDIRFSWSKAWDKAYIKLNYINKYIEVGNQISPKINHSKKNNDLAKKKLIIYTGDITNKHVKNIYTKSYTLKHIKAIFSVLKKNPEINNKYQVFLKVKEISHKKSINILFEKDSKMLEAIKPNFIVGHKGKNIGESISKGDVFISIGFTSPGFDALCYKKPSAYIYLSSLKFTTIPIDRKLILDSEVSIKEFLINPYEFLTYDQKKIEPFMDGNTVQRIYEFIK